MQAYKARKGTRFRYSSAYLSRVGMLRAWHATDIDKAGIYRRDQYSKIFCARRIMIAQRWRFDLENGKAA